MLIYSLKVILKFLYNVQTYANLNSRKKITFKENYLILQNFQALNFFQVLLSSVKHFRGKSTYEGKSKNFLQ